VEYKVEVVCRDDGAMLASAFRSSFLVSSTEPAFCDHRLPESSKWVSVDSATISTGLPEDTTRVYSGSAIADVTKGITKGIARSVVNPGGFLRPIGQERLRPNATSKQIGSGVRRTVELPGQELLDAGTWFSAYRRRSKRRRTGRGPSRSTAAQRTGRRRIAERG
jgi:hypothetical protein